MTPVVRDQAFRSIVHLLALIFLYGIVSASVMDRFMIPNGGLTHPYNASFDRYLQHEAQRPFAYRVLVPLVVGALEPLITPNLSEAQGDKLTITSPLRDYMKVPQDTPLNLQMSVRYHLGYAMSFLSLVALAFALRALALAINPEKPALSSLAPIAFLILLPLSFLHGGYLYDFPELLFLALSLWAIIKNRFSVLCLILPLAILNKESNVLILMFYAAYSWNDVPANTLIKRTAVLLLIAAASYLLGRYLAPDAGGTTVFFNLKRNLAFLANPETWFQWYRLYDGLIPIPRGYNLLSLGLLAAVLAAAWPALSSALKRVLVSIFLINLYLVLMHGFKDELRNWSLSFIPLYAAIVAYAASRIAPPATKQPSADDAVKP